MINRAIKVVALKKKKKECILETLGLHFQPQLKQNPRLVLPTPNPTSALSLPAP